MSDLKEEFWERMDDVRACMPGAVWFITAKGTDLAQSVANGAQPAQMVVSDDKSGLYADVRGMLDHSTDREALDEAWSFVAGAWFDGGQHDPDVCLLRFTPKTAKMSITSGGGAKFLYEIAKAHLTSDKPDMGEQGEVSF